MSFSSGYLLSAIFLIGPRLNSTRRSAIVLCLSSVELNWPFLTGRSTRWLGGFSLQIINISEISWLTSLNYTHHPRSPSGFETLKLLIMPSLPQLHIPTNCWPFWIPKFLNLLKFTLLPATLLSLLIFTVESQLVKKFPCLLPILPVCTCPWTMILQYSWT